MADIKFLQSFRRLVGDLYEGLKEGMREGDIQLRQAKAEVEKRQVEASEKLAEKMGLKRIAEEFVEKVKEAAGEPKPAQVALSQPPPKPRPQVAIPTQSSLGKEIFKMLEQSGLLNPPEIKPDSLLNEARKVIEPYAEREEELWKQKQELYQQLLDYYMNKPEINVDELIKLPEVPQRINTLENLGVLGKLAVAFTTIAATIRGLKVGIPELGISTFSGIVRAFKERDDEEYIKRLKEYELQMQRWNAQLDALKAQLEVEKYNEELKATPVKLGLQMINDELARIDTAKKYAFDITKLAQDLLKNHLDHLNSRLQFYTQLYQLIHAIEMEPLSKQLMLAQIQEALARAKEAQARAQALITGGFPLEVLEEYTQQRREKPPRAIER